MSSQHARTPEHQHQPVDDPFSRTICVQDRRQWARSSSFIWSGGRFAHWRTQNITGRTTPPARCINTHVYTCPLHYRYLLTVSNHLATPRIYVFANIYAISLRICCRHSDSTSRLCHTTDIDVFEVGQEFGSARMPKWMNTFLVCIYCIFAACLGSPTKHAIDDYMYNVDNRMGGSCCWLWLCVYICVLVDISKAN